MAGLSITLFPAALRDTSLDSSHGSPAGRRAGLCAVRPDARACSMRHTARLLASEKQKAHLVPAPRGGITVGLATWSMGQMGRLHDARDSANGNRILPP